MKTLILYIAALLLCGCATVSKQEAATANFGPLPSNYQDRVKAFMSTQLRDPFSAVYYFETPRKGFFQDGLLAGGKKHFGWIVPVAINAKNGFGGYAGQEQHYVFLGSDSTMADCTISMGQMANFVKG